MMRLIGTFWVNDIAVVGDAVRGSIICYRKRYCLLLARVRGITRGVLRYCPHIECVQYRRTIRLLPDDARAKPWRVGEAGSTGV